MDVGIGPNRVRATIVILGCTGVLMAGACGDDDSGSGADPRPDAGGPDAGPAPETQTPLAGGKVPQFAQALPTLSAAGGSLSTLAGNQPLTIRMCEFWANVLPPGTFSPGEQPKTRVWGYVEGDACPPGGPGAAARDTYIGPVIISERSNPPDAPRAPTTVTWVNDLGTADTTQVLAYRLSTDQTLHWADPNGLGCMDSHDLEKVPQPGSPCAKNYAGPIPAVVHLHGGEVPPVIDGNPDAWFLSQPLAGFTMHGGAYYSMDGDAGNQAVYAYPNTQEAAPLWFHDHTLGTTTLNVYAGLAGGYLVVDPDLTLPPGLTATGLAGPDATNQTLIPLVLQDRSFDTDGQLFYPADHNGGMQAAANPQHPFWTPEAFLDTNVVNGKVWPFLDVEPRRYRFVVVEGANSRAYSLSLFDSSSGTAGPPLWVIGNEEGYLDAPMEVDPAAGQELVVMPGERYDVIIDFTGLAPGTTLVLRNSAPSPYPDGTPPDPATTGRVMQFRVGPCQSGACGAGDPSYDPASGVPILTGANALVRFTNPETGQMVASAPVARVRDLTLVDFTLEPTTATDPATGTPDTDFPGGSLLLMLNNTLWSGESSRPYDDFVPVTLNGTTLRFSEVIHEGDAELWELVNMTPDAHPIHIHLADMQIVNRQDFNTDGYQAVYAAAFPGGEFIPGFGPPLDYNTGNPDALGGNPDVTPFLTGDVQPPQPYESGWKDTVIAPPGQVTRVVVRFAPSDLPLEARPAQRSYAFDPSDWLGYPWHCHITTHEDNEMMRAFLVQLNPAAPPPAERALQRGRDY